MSSHRVAGLLAAVATIFLVPMAGYAKPGDVYKKSGGPKVSVQRARRTPPGLRVCREYRLSARDRGRVQDDYDPKSFETCKKGVRAARRVADDYSSSRGLEDGYLRGYAWGLKKGASKGVKDKSAAEQAKQAAFDSHELSEQIQKAELGGQRQGKADALKYARVYFADAFTAQQDPKTKASDHPVNAPAIELYEDAHLELFGPMPSRDELIKMSAGGERLAIPAADLRTYFKNKSYSISKLYDANGVFAFDSAKAADVQAGWVTWERAGQVETDGYATMAPSQKKIFEKSFRAAYDGYATYGYSAMFYRSLDVGTRDGYRVGKQLGTTARYHAALRTAFNESYAAQVPERFQSEYRASWTQMWDSHVAMLKAEPQLTIKNVALVDKVRDGVFSPGEELMVQVTVENRSLVKAELPTEIRGPIEAPAPAWVDIPAFRSLDVTSKALASVDSSTRLRKKARFEVYLGKDAHKFEHVIRQIMEIDGIEATDIDPINGAGTLEVTIVNPTTNTSAKQSTVSLVIDGRTVTTSAVQQIPSKKSVTVSMPFTGTDPLLLLGGTAEAGLDLKTGKTSLHQRHLRLPSDEQEEWLLAYFDGLAYGEAVVPAGRNRDDQILRVQEALVTLGQNEIKRNEKRNAWRSSPRSTLVGRVLEKVATSGSNIRIHYRPLADQLCSMEPEMKGRTRRKAYSSLCVRIDRLLQESEMEGDVPVPAAEELPDSDPLDDIESIETSSTSSRTGKTGTR